MSVHASLDLYAFVALTASLPTLTQLIDMVRTDNNCRQEQVNTSGATRGRTLNVSAFPSPVLTYIGY